MAGRIIDYELALQSGERIVVDWDIHEHLIGKRVILWPTGYVGIMLDVAAVSVKVVDEQVTVSIYEQAVSLHRFVMHPPPGKSVHHKLDRRDNRREHLEIISTSTNSAVRLQKCSPWGSNVYQSAHGAWSVRMKKDGMQYKRGPFTTPHEARLEADALFLNLHGIKRAKLIASKLPTHKNAAISSAQNEVIVLD